MIATTRNFKNFSIIFNQFLESQSNSSKDISTSILLDHNSQSLHINNKLFKKPVNEHFQYLLEILELLLQNTTSDQDGLSFFSGLKQLKIEFSNCGIEIEFSLMNSIIQSLEQFDDVPSIMVTESNEKEFNPYSLCLFTSIEITRANQSYYYESKSTKKRAIQLIQRIDHEGLLNSIFNFNNSMPINWSDNSDINSIPDFSRLMKKLYQIDTERRKILTKNEITNQSNSSSSNKSELTSQLSTLIEKRKKKLSLCLNVQNQCLYPQVLSVLNLLRIFNFDETRVSQFEFTIFDCLERDHKEPETFKAELIDLREFQPIELYRKMHFKYPSIKVFQLDLFLQMAKFVKSINTNLPSENPKTILQCINLLELNNKNLNNQYSNLEILKLNQVKTSNLKNVFNLAQMFPNLNSLIIAIDQKDYFYFDIFPFIEGMAPLILRLNQFILSDFLILSKDRLKMKITLSHQSRCSFYELIPKAISCFGRNIHLELEFLGYLSSKEYKQNFELLRRMFGIPEVAEFKIQNYFYATQNDTIQDRNSTYLQISAFNLLIAPHMLYNPAAILLDLFFVD